MIIKVNSVEKTTTPDDEWDVGYNCPSLVEQIEGKPEIMAFIIGQIKYASFYENPNIIDIVECN